MKVQAAEKFKENEEIQDPVKLTLALHQVAYNVQYKTHFPLSQWNITRRLHLTKQDKDMSLLQYYERFKSIAETADYVDIKLGIGKGMKDFVTQSSATETAAEIYRGISFLMGGDRYYYWKLLEELHNDYLSGNDRYPKSLDEAYTLMSDLGYLSLPDR